MSLCISNNFYNYIKSSADLDQRAPKGPSESLHCLKNSSEHHKQVYIVERVKIKHMMSVPLELLFCVGLEDDGYVGFRLGRHHQGQWAALA